MRYFITSLIVVTLISVLAVGWGVSQIYSLLGDNEIELDDNLAGIKILGKELASVLDSLPEKDEFIELWQSENELKISLQASDDFPIPGELANNFQDGEPLILETADDLSINFFLTNSSEVLSFSLPKNISRNAVTAQNLILTMVFYVGIVVIMLIWIFPLILRLLKLRSTTAKFGNGDLTLRIKTSNTSYISQIEFEFNRMASRIQSLIEDNKLLSRAVSHNLKTPLMRLRFGVDSLKEAKDSQNRDKYFQWMERDLSEMESLVETLLQYARLEQSSIKPEMEEIELSETVMALVDSARNTSVDVKFTCPEKKIILLSDKNFLEIQLNNIFENALHYAKEKVHVSISTRDGNVVCTMEDDGSGIAIEDIENVVQPFWRGAINSKTKGHGMGLAIASRIGEWLNCEMKIDKSELLGGAAIHLIYTRTIPNR